jgi:Transglutaminase-like superfamily
MATSSQPYREGSATGISPVPRDERARECPVCRAGSQAPDRFCWQCGSPLSRQGRPTEARGGRAPSPLTARLPSVAPGAWGVGSLTAQQLSLVRAVALNRTDYLEHSYYRDAATGKRMAHSVTDAEWARFAATWATEPVACIGAVNRVIAALRGPARIGRYLEAAVDLETLMDRGTMRTPQGRVFLGIPGYIMDGYTDMGGNASPTARRGREKIRIDKERLKPWLVQARSRALAHDLGPERLLAGFYDSVRHTLRYDEPRVRELSSGRASTSINMSRFLDEGIGLCRHMSILYQLCLQEAAIPGRVVKGSLRICGVEGRHAWNLAWVGGHVAFVDVAAPSRHGPMIVIGASQEEAYRLANQGDRRYVATPDGDNHYKIGRSPGSLPARPGGL